MAAAQAKARGEAKAMITHYCWSCGVFKLIDRICHMCQSCLDEWIDVIEVERHEPRR